MPANRVGKANGNPALGVRRDSEIDEVVSGVGRPLSQVIAIVSSKTSVNLSFSCREYASK